jgi:hypothetical protein
MAQMGMGGVPGAGGGGAQPTFNVAPGESAPPAAAGVSPGPAYGPTTPIPASGNVYGAPQVGEVRKGYRFKGGNPADPNAWEQVQ